MDLPIGRGRGDGLGVDAMKDKSEPAYPCDRILYYGITMRDYFAAHERSFPPLSWIQARIGSHINDWSELKGAELAEAMVAWRYQMADAMIEEREK
jgi:hypothetical protein